MLTAHPLVEKKRNHAEHGLADMGAKVLAALEFSIACLRDQDTALAQTIISGDDAIDRDRSRRVRLGVEPLPLRDR